MHARVTRLRIRPGKLEEFVTAFDSIIPTIQKQAGFRALLVLRNPTAAPEATVVSAWDSLEELRASEQNMFLFQALARILSYCEGFPVTEEHELLVGDFAVR